MLPSRVSDQCRQRWVNSLSPDRASNTVEEEYNAGNDKAHESEPVRPNGILKERYSSGEDYAWNHDHSS
jgi:hypothetical protein